MTLVVVEALFTVSVSIDEVLALWLASPLYLAVIEFEPTEGNATLLLPVPFVSVVDPIKVDPSYKDTVPVGVPELELTKAAKFTG